MMQQALTPALSRKRERGQAATVDSLSPTGRGRGEGSQTRVSKARELRWNSTDAEKKFWQLLRSRQLDGFKFRRQHAIGHYIVDFVCIEQNLIIELDGGQHNESKYDENRDAWLRGQGFRILRFWNNDALSNSEGVQERILQSLNGEVRL